MVLLIKRLHLNYLRKWSYKLGWSYPRGWSCIADYTVAEGLYIPIGYLLLKIDTFLRGWFAHISLGNIGYKRCKCAVKLSGHAEDYTCLMPAE